MARTPARARQDGQSRCLPGNGEGDPGARPWVAVSFGGEGRLPGRRRGAGAEAGRWGRRWPRRWALPGGRKVRWCPETVRATVVDGGGEGRRQVRAAASRPAVDGRRSPRRCGSTGAMAQIAQGGAWPSHRPARRRTSCRPGGRATHRHAAAANSPGTAQQQGRRGVGHRPASSSVRAR